MHIEISSEYEAVVTQAAKQSGYTDVQQYITMLIQQDVELQAVQEGLASADAGRVKSLEQFEQDFRHRSGLTPDA